MGKAGSDPSDNKHEQPLQAVLLADTFDNAWHPITLESYDGHADGTKGKERPLVLCPLNNVPLLNHSIDFLQVRRRRLYGCLFAKSLLTYHVVSSRHVPSRSSSDREPESANSF